MHPTAAIYQIALNAICAAEALGNLNDEEKAAAKALTRRFKDAQRKHTGEAAPSPCRATGEYQQPTQTAGKGQLEKLAELLQWQINTAALVAVIAVILTFFLFQANWPELRPAEIQAPQFEAAIQDQAPAPDPEPTPVPVLPYHPEKPIVRESPWKP